MRSVRAAGFRGRSRNRRSSSFATVHQLLQRRLRLATIAWPALFSNRAWRPLALVTAASIASASGSGMQASKILARLSTNANTACCARPSREISRLIWSMLVASRSSAPSIVSSRPFNSWSIAVLRNALGLAYPRSFTADWSRSSASTLNRIVRLGMIVSALYKGNGGGPAGRDFANNFDRRTNGRRSGRASDAWAEPGMSQLVQETNQRVRQPFMFHYAFFVA